MDDPLQELWDMVGPPNKLRGGLRPSPEVVAQAAIEALNKRCVYEVRDGDRVVRIEAPSADEVLAIRRGGWPADDDTVEVVHLTEAP